LTKSALLLSSQLLISLTAELLEWNQQAMFFTGDGKEPKFGISNMNRMGSKIENTNFLSEPDKTIHCIEIFSDRLVV